MSLFRVASLSIRPLALVAGGLALWALAGHLARLGWMFRLFPGSYGMHELTAVTGLALALAIALRGQGGRRKRVSFLVQTLAAIGLVLTLGRFVPALEPLYGVQSPYFMARHSAISLGLIAAAVLAQERGAFMLGVGLFYVALGSALMQLAANLFQMREVTGAMSLATAVMILLLAAGGMLGRANRGVMRVLLNTHASGRQARTQILLGVAGPLIFGFFYILFDRERTVRAEVLLLVVTIAGFNIGLISLMAMSLERADHARRELERQMARQAMRDGLTGLFNRAVLERRFSRAAAQGYKYGVPFAFVMVDLDHFKRVNDLGGHDFGDGVLRNAAKVMRAVLRHDDTLARVGGEEFAVLLPGADLEAAFEVGERLRQAVAEASLAMLKGHRVPVTASVGVAQWHPGESLQEVYVRTDRALYRAKGKGRNQVMVAEGEGAVQVDLSDFARSAGGATPGPQAGGAGD
ncbi:diguanylate cyclase [Thioclava pacifica]|uniref:diguanylate cyclase n=1 Tax=Thioclava pacifica DSM 10166 TaxID=1353537 RepID=A0A074JLR5_9RHOB|nr:diguanylate cyclase [Thioclava pacifica]KEO56523.1 hypothetical protein TP2_03060 [Thioclava pacifica DSM 10166]